MSREKSRFTIVRNGPRRFWIWDARYAIVFASFTDRDQAERKLEQLRRHFGEAS